MSPVLHLAAKDLRLLARDPMGLFWIFAFPVIMALFFGAIFGGNHDPKARALSIVVVDEDGSDAARSFIARLEKSESLLVSRGTRAEAREAVRLGNRAAYVVVQKGFGESAGLFGGGQAPRLEVGIDPARKAEGGYLQGLLIQASFEGLRESFGDPKKMREMVTRGRSDLGKDGGLDPAQRSVFESFFSGLDHFLADVDPKAYSGGPQFRAAEIEPVAVPTEQEGPHSAFEVSFPQGILWGLLGCAASFAISLVLERVHGTFLRLSVAPLSRAQILGGKAVACFAACVSVTLALLLLGVVACGVRLQNLVALALAVPCTAACFVGLMMFVSVLGKTEPSVSGAGWGLNTVLAMLGGGMVPLFLMPPWMKTLSHVSPVKWAVLALEGAIWRGFSPAEMAWPCAALLAFGGGFFLLGWWRLGRLERT